MQPGGKRELGEDDASALARELTEEIGCAPAAGSLRFLGTFSAPAAHEPGTTVEAALYRVQVVGKIAPGAEIAELAWIDPAVPGPIRLAQLTRDHVLPLARG